MKQDPLALLRRALDLWLQGRISIGRDLPGAHLRNRGERFSAFRKVVVRGGSRASEGPGAVFTVRFRFKNLWPGLNRLLSLLPIPFIVAQPGFRSKTWLLGSKTGDFMGRYEFDSVESARAYGNSLPLGMMRVRAAPGSLSSSIVEHPAPSRVPSAACRARSKCDADETAGFR